MKKIFTVVLCLVLCLISSSCEGCNVAEKEKTVYNISAKFDGEKVIDAKMQVDYFNNTETEITELKFNLYPNAFREDAKLKPVPVQSMAQAYPNGVSYGGIEITNCAQDGEIIGFEISGVDSNILVLCLKNGVFPSERTILEINFTSTLPNCKLRYGYFNGVVNLGNWYPVLCVHESAGFYECTYSSVGDPFYSEVSDYNVNITVPGEYTVASGGECLKTVVDGNITTYSFTFENVRDVAFCLSKDFEVFAGNTGDIDIYFYYTECDFVGDVGEAIERAIDVYSNLFGEYSYDVITVVETPFLQGGMEYPQLVYVSDALGKEDFITATVHEVAHQWWYATVGNNQCEYAFLDEGLAEYSTLLFYENYPEYGVERDEIVNAKTTEYHAFYGVFDQLTGKVNTKMQRNLSGFSGEYEYVEISYVKSILMFDGFRESVGDKKFFKGLKRYYEDLKFKLATPDHLISSFEKSGCDAQGYFYSWIDGKVII